jgi:trk system potassium uptake protein TrkA
VAVIDKEPRAFRRLYEDFKGRKITGVGFDRDRLRDAGIEEAGALAAVTNGDNSNILVARVARENFGVENVVARIYDPKRAVIYERLGIPTIATVQWTTDRVLHRLFPDSAGSVWSDPSAAIHVIERPVTAKWAGRRLADIEIAGVARVVALTRMGAAQVATPDLVAQDGDVVYLAVTAEKLSELENHLGLPAAAVESPAGSRDSAEAGGSAGSAGTGDSAADGQTEPAAPASGSRSSTEAAAGQGVGRK